MYITAAEFEDYDQHLCNLSEFEDYDQHLYNLSTHTNFMSKKKVSI
jgi:hypothetical protein